MTPTGNAIQKRSRKPRRPRTAFGRAVEAHWKAQGWSKSYVSRGSGLHRQTVDRFLMTDDTSRLSMATVTAMAPFCPPGLLAG